MNAKRRKMIAKAIGCISQAGGLLEEAHSNGQSAYDNLPPSMQDSQRGELWPKPCQIRRRTPCFLVRGAYGRNACR
jgi:hypothetical protein